MLQSERTVEIIVEVNEESSTGVGHVHDKGAVGDIGCPFIDATLCGTIIDIYAAIKGDGETCRSR